MVDVQLPVELFQLVTEQSSRPTQKTLLLVSKMFHDLALPALFSRVTLTFGIKRKPARNWNRSASWTEEEVTQLKKRYTKSKNILQHIAENSEFAQVVRRLTVRWYELPLALSNRSALGE